MHRNFQKKLFKALYLTISLTIISCHSYAAEEIVFGTDWRAQAEHGGFYQAQALGFYEELGLKVRIKQGGPQVNHSQQLVSGKIDFGMAPNSFIPLNFLEQSIPIIAIAAFFQRDPAVLIAHKSQNYSSLTDLKYKKIMISPDTRIGFWRFLRVRFGFNNQQIKPYTFNLAPFLANEELIQQGYLTSEPFLIKQTGIQPSVFLLADSGYNSYAGIVQCSEALIQENPALVTAFINASIKGWYSFLYDDPSPAFRLISVDNPEMDKRLLEFAHQIMLNERLIDNEDSRVNGIGTMNLRRWKAFYETMVQDALYSPDLNISKVFTNQFASQSDAFKERQKKLRKGNQIDR